MPTLKESLQSKVDTLGIGELAHLPDLLVTNIGDGVAARSIWNDPRIYKPIFSLDKLGIDKSLKSVVMEVRDSVARVYYILDSSCFFVSFDCDYQTLDVIKELPTEVIHYLRILCSKKGKLEIIAREDNLYLLFEDTFPSKMPAKERKEKEVDKYVLSIPLKEVDELDNSIVEFVKKIVELEDTSPVSHENFNIPMNFSTITINKEPIEYWKSIVSTEKGDFTIVDTSGINATLVICPTLVSTQFWNKFGTEEVVPELNIKEVELDELIPDLDYSHNYEEDMQSLDDTADLVNSFMGDFDE